MEEHSPEKGERTHPEKQNGKDEDKHRLRERYSVYFLHRPDHQTKIPENYQNRNTTIDEPPPVRNDASSEQCRRQTENERKMTDKIPGKEPSALLRAGKDGSEEMSHPGGK